MGVPKQRRAKNCLPPHTHWGGFKAKKKQTQNSSATISEVYLTSNMKNWQHWTARDWIMLTSSELLGQIWDSFLCYCPSCAGLWINRKFQSNYSNAICKMNRQHMEQKDFPVFPWKWMRGIWWTRNRAWLPKVYCEQQKTIDYIVSVG